MESSEGIMLKCKQWIQSWFVKACCGKVRNGLEGSHGSAGLVEVRYGLLRLGAAVKAGQRREWWGQNWQGSRGLVSQGMLCLGAERLGKAVMVWKSRLGKSGRCKDG